VRGVGHRCTLAFKTAALVAVKGTVMRSFNVVAPFVASCLWLAACGARSDVRCFGDTCVGGEGVGFDDPLGGAGSSTLTPPTLPGRPNSAGRPLESPEGEWMQTPPALDPGPDSYCAESSTARGPLTITNREELARLEGCRRVEGDLTIIISGSRSDLGPLNALTRVSGTLAISMSGSLEGLENLTRAGHLTLTDLDVPTLEPLTNLTFLTGNVGEDEDGQLTIQRSPSLRDVGGLGSLRAVRSVVVSENTRLESLNGLSVPPYLSEVFIANNPNLRDLAALGGLTSVDRIDIQGNDALTSLQGLDGVTGAASLHLSNSPALRDAGGLSQLLTLDSLSVDGVGLPSLDGLRSLTRVREVVLRSNASLTQVDALARLELLDDLVVTDNPRLLGLPDFPVIGVMDRVLVRGNAALATGPSFPSLIETDALTISENPRLTRIDGFPVLRAVRRVEVSENQDLLELELNALEDVNRLRIFCNPKLPEASLAPLLSLGAEVHGNAGSLSPCASGGPP
jgi:hypothetical protein